MAEESLENQFLDTPGRAAGLRARMVSGGFWVFALRITNRIFGLARTIVLARLLAPAQFGLFGIALLVMSALEIFSETGFNAALVQKKGDTKPYLDTAWTVQVIRGILLALIAFAIAPYVATFFNAPAAKPILQVIACSVLLGGFTNIGVVYFQKELEFHKQFVFMFCGTLADISVAIPAAFLLRNTWALVLGLLAGNVVRTLMSHFVHPYRPRLAFNREQFKELFGFGKWILASSILVFLATKGGDAFLGKVLGAASLGLYQLAYRISNMPATEYSCLISTTAYPAYSKLQDNIPKLREAYLKVLQLSAFLSIPIAGCIFILAPEFIKIFLGAKWMPMVPPMQVLALFGMVNSIVIPGPIFMAIGKPELRTKLHIFNIIILGVLIYPFTNWWGMTGTAIAVTAYAVIGGIVAMVIAFRVIDADCKTLLKILLPPVFNTLIMVLVVSCLKTLVFHSINLASFLMLTFLSILTYMVIAWSIDKTFSYRAGGLLKEQFAILFKMNR